MTLNDVLTTIERRLMAGKALDAHLNQITDRLKAMTGVDVGNVDDGLYLAEAKIKAGAEAQAENADMRQTMSEIRGKVNALLSNSGTGWRIHSVHRALDRLREEYDRVKDQSMRNAGLAAERENMISDVIGELRLILGTPKIEDPTLAKITDLLKANHTQREIMIRFFDDMRTVVGEPNATPKYIEGMVAEMRGTMACASARTCPCAWTRSTTFWAGHIPSPMS